MASFELLEFELKKAPLVGSRLELELGLVALAAAVVVVEGVMQLVC